MKVVFVTPRYDPAAIGGAESAARRLAEHLAAEPGFEVAAYSTRAVDHLTWANALPEGTSTLNGVEVSRFSVAEQRQHEFFKTDGRLRLSPRRVTWEQSERWLELNGPKAPGLIEALASTDADITVFSPYLFLVTVAGIRASRAPSVLHSAAHDEPPLYFPAIGDAFGRADALCYYTAAERRLVQRLHPVADKPQIVLGLGLGDPVEGGRRGDDVLGIDGRPYLLSLGRVEDHKGSVMLDTFFRRYKERRPGPLVLAHVGPVASASELEPHPDIVVTGAVDEPTKGDLLRDATALVSPSALESFSLVIMEAWEQGIPVVVNALCEPTRDHCAHSCGGMWFGSYRQFEVVLDRLLADEGLRRWLGSNGRAYVAEHFQWPALTSRYARFLTSVLERGRSSAPR
jgi:glycosyltransferase involved in cell wall biosynthesis